MSFWEREEFQSREDLEVEIEVLREEIDALEKGLIDPFGDLSVGDRVDDLLGMIEDLHQELAQVRG